MNLSVHGLSVFETNIERVRTRLQSTFICTIFIVL